MILSINSFLVVFPFCTSISDASISPVNSADVIHSTGILRRISIILIPCGVADIVPALARLM